MQNHNRMHFGMTHVCLIRVLPEIWAVMLLCVLTACKPVGPNYVAPSVAAPAIYEEAKVPETPGVHWKEAGSGKEAEPEKWWMIFGDVQLDEMEKQLDHNNVQLLAATAQYRSATEALRGAKAAYMPQLSVTALPQHEAASDTVANVPHVRQYNDFALTLQASWEPDLWGRIRRYVEAYGASAQASSADLASVRLSLEAQLALAYLNLRGTKLQAKLLDETTALLKDQVRLTHERLSAGIASEVDLVQAQAQLDSTQAQRVDLDEAEAQYQHAIAILLSKAPADSKVDPKPLDIDALPKVPVGIPSELLERRPDIAAAERRVAQANAQVGMAITAYYPSLTIGTENYGAGFESHYASTLVQGPSVVWSLGAKATQMLFDGGQRKAFTAAARDNLEVASNNYRRVVLSSFGEVEDNLASLRILDGETALQQKAVQEAARSLELSRMRYERGTTSYLEVIVAENTLLSNQRSVASLVNRRYVATVGLLKAVGGGWNRGQLPH